MERENETKVKITVTGVKHGEGEIHTFTISHLSVVGVMIVREGQQTHTATKVDTAIVICQ